MSSLIKGAASQLVRPFLRSAATDSTPQSLESCEAELAQDPRLAELSRENEALRKALEQAAVDLERAKAAAREGGKREALESFRSDDLERIGVLKTGISSALDKWGQRLSEIEGLAVLLCRTALGKVFEEPGNRCEMVIELIAQHIRRLRRETVLAVRVSRSDFPDEAALQSLSDAAGRSVAIADPDLQSGECRLDLELGHVEIGPSTQWALLASFLDDLTAERQAK